MEELIEIANGIIKYGVVEQPSLQNKEEDLERNLVRLYSVSFELLNKNYKPHGEDFNRTNLPDIVKVVMKNFPEFGYYHIVLNPVEVNTDPEPALGDAIDDLSDIIRDLLEFKWRYTNNGKEDALWFFKLMFSVHIQPHLLGLLVYLNEIKE